MNLGVGMGMSRDAGQSGKGIGGSGTVWEETGSGPFLIHVVHTGGGGDAAPTPGHS